MKTCIKCGSLKTKKSGKYFRCPICTTKRCKEWSATKERRAVQKQYRMDNAKRRQDYEQKRRQNLHQKLLNHYGTKCECCGENRPKTLCFDHINGNGEIHRKEVGNGTKFQWWLLKSNFPPEFRTLCWNCNFCTWAYGQCVHKGLPTKTGGLRYEYMKKIRLEIRLKIFLHYGDGKLECKYCKENHFEFLVLDHIDGGGKEHQRKVGRGSSFYKWIVNNDFPSGFQVLCHNCNAIKGT